MKIKGPYRPYPITSCLTYKCNNNNEDNEEEDEDSSEREEERDDDDDDPYNKKLDETTMTKFTLDQIGRASCRER